MGAKHDLKPTCPYCKSDRVLVRDGYIRRDGSMLNVENCFHCGAWWTRVYVTKSKYGKWQPDTHRRVESGYSLPVVFCRCCGQLMDVIFQEALMPGREGYHLVTCWNKECPMEGQTLSERRYADMDLSKYLCKEAVE